MGQLLEIKIISKLLKLNDNKSLSQEWEGLEENRRAHTKMIKARMYELKSRAWASKASLIITANMIFVYMYLYIFLYLYIYISVCL